LLSLQVVVMLLVSSVDDVTTSETFVSGTVSGSYADTQSSDGAYESIHEIDSHEGRRRSYSFLEHKWTIDVTGGDTVTFYVEAHHTANTEGDDFSFAYSTNNSVYTDMLTVTKTIDDHTYKRYQLPDATSGTVYIRVVDTDRTEYNNTLDTIYIDHMFIRSKGVVAGILTVTSSSGGSVTVPVREISSMILVRL